jgi:hypothetical protein
MMGKGAMFCAWFPFRTIIVCMRLCRFPLSGSTKLDAEKRLALQEEKQAMEAKLLEV